jgi:hypothetical protein
MEENMNKLLTILEEYMYLLDSDTFELWVERSSIMEHCGGLDRQLADALAMLVIIRKHPELLPVINEPAEHTTRKGGGPYMKKNQTI